MNNVCLMGRLTADPRMNGNSDGLIARYTLAVDRAAKQGEQKQADFIGCVCFGKTAEFASKWLKKGTKVAIIGRITTGSYDKDGQKIYTTDVIVNNHFFCESKGTANTETQKQASNEYYPMSDDDPDDDLPF